MPTKTERALTKKLVSLAMDISEGGKFDACADVRASGVDFRVSDKGFIGGEYLFYGENTAYFARSPWVEADFIERINVFIVAANKYKSLGRKSASEKSE